ncbi:MAG: cobalamin-binding protein [Bdellovibrionaceae bacterium]|nr:cobalamin-binding protein [Bdellovibrionales bacterium]MCB9253290.1 cobalamin-binding protein [Pseudobdellovibrionaceae bacterium]
MQNATVVSLLPSATEILCALGLQKQLVGVSHECDFPQEIKGLPVLTESKIDPNAPSAQIDGKVRTLVQKGLSLYEIRTDLLQTLKPDWIFTQDQCEVCAVSLEDVTCAVKDLFQSPVNICSLKPESLDDIWRDIRKVAEAMGVEERGEKIVQAIYHRINPLRGCFSTRPRVACLEWLDPPMVAGGWIPEIVEIAGGEPVIVSEPGPFKEVSWDTLREVDPDFLVLMPCGFSVERTEAELKNIPDGIRQLRAVQQGRCYIVDGNAYFNRPGPRIADSCEILAALVHPEKCLAFLNRYRSAIAQWPRS